MYRNSFDLKTVKEVIKSVLLSFSHPVPLSDLEKEYVKLEGYPIPFRELGYPSCQNFILSMKDDINISTLKNGKFLLEAKADESCKHIKKLVKSQKNSTKKRANNSKAILNKAGNPRYYTRPSYAYKEDAAPKPQTKSLPEPAVARIQALLRHHPEGLMPMQIYNLYQKEFSGFAKELDWKLHGFSSLETLLLTAPSGSFRLHYTTLGYRFYSNDTVPLPAPLPKTAVEKHNKEDAKEYFSTESSKRNSKPGISTDWVCHGESYECINMEKLTVGSWVKVVVVEVYDPDDFYLVLHSPENFTKLSKLMDEMILFYEKNYADWRLNDRDCIWEQVVAVYNTKDKNLYRGVIRGFKGRDQVKVYFVDYGTLLSVDKEHLFYLHKQFFKLPAQAILAKLHGIQPNESIRWTRKASSRFLQLVQFRVLYANIIKKSDFKISVSMVYTSSSADICIEYQLVYENYASFANDDDCDEVAVKYSDDNASDDDEAPETTLQPKNSSTCSRPPPAEQNAKSNAAPVISATGSHKCLEQRSPEDEAYSPAAKCTTYKSAQARESNSEGEARHHLNSSCNCSKDTNNNEKAEGGNAFTFEQLLTLKQYNSRKPYLSRCACNPQKPDAENPSVKNFPCDNSLVNVASSEHVSSPENSGYDELFQTARKHLTACVSTLGEIRVRIQEELKNSHDSEDQYEQIFTLDKTIKALKQIAI